MNNRQIQFSPPDITESEIQAVTDALRSGWITTGPKAKLFEQKIAEYCCSSKAACLNSATAALELTLRILGIGEGDEVITSAYTYTASASVICHVGATPVLIDTKKDSFEMDYDSLENAVNSKTKAIIPVDFAGIMCDYDRILEIARKRSACFHASSGVAAAIGRIAVIADSAHSFGAVQNGKPNGSIADFTCFSFHAVKNLTTAEGGAVTFSNTDGKDIDDIYKQYMLLSLHGQSKDALAKTRLGAWEYDIISPAYKCNMTDIMAAIGLAQLERYPSILARRREIIKRYNDALSDRSDAIAPLSHFTSNSCSAGHLYVLRLIEKTLDQRNEIIIKLAEQGVSSNVHYKPLPMLTAYKKMGFDIKDFPNAYSLFENELTLPLHTLLSNDDVDYVAECLLKLI